jgi:hypothetical protein
MKMTRTMKRREGVKKKKGKGEKEKKKRRMVLLVVCYAPPARMLLAMKGNSLKKDDGADGVDERQELLILKACSKGVVKSKWCR